VSHDTPPRWFITEDGRDFAVTFWLVSSLFLIWGFCNGLIDVMDKHFQDELHLSKAQSAWVQSAHYLGYALMAVPAGMLARGIGYKGGIIAGLLVVAAGGFWFIAATAIASFWAFLAGVSVIAIGLTILETVANPYTTALGPKELGAFRINLAQSLNGLGWMLGPVVGGAFFYSEGGTIVSHERLSVPYIAVALLVLGLAGVFARANMPDLTPRAEPQEDRVENNSPRSIWHRPHFVGAVVAQFLYVAAQAGIFSFFINYMVSESPPLPRSWADGVLGTGLTARQSELFINERGAAELQGLVGFGLFLAGRLIGTALLTRTRASRLLGHYALVNTLLCAIVVLRLGWLSVAAVFLTFFFMSISFPTLFALGIDGLGAHAKRASAFIVMAILGGAILPKVMGYLGDVYDMSTSFLMPLVCFALIASYAYAWPALRSGRAGRAPVRG
jgi:FHS family L-fucose permease-like MFS transporter